MINFGSRPLSNQTQIKENKINNTNISLNKCIKRHKKKKKKKMNKSQVFSWIKLRFKYSAVFLASAFFSLTLYPLQGDQLAGILTSSPSSHASSTPATPR